MRVMTRKALSIKARTGGSGRDQGRMGLEGTKSSHECEAVSSAAWLVPSLQAHVRLCH